MKKIKSQKLIFILVVFFSFVAFSALAQTTLKGVPATEPSGGLVPCGPGKAREVCTLCDLIVGFHNLTRYGLYIITIIALLGATFAGIMYVVSSGDESMITSAKNFLKASLIGFSVVIGAWLIINVTLWSISAKPGAETTNKNFGIISNGNWYSFNLDCGSSSTSKKKYKCDPMGNGGCVETESSGVDTFDSEEACKSSCKKVVKLGDICDKDGKYTCQELIPNEDLTGYECKNGEEQLVGSLINCGEIQKFWGCCEK